MDHLSTVLDVPPSHQLSPRLLNSSAFRISGATLCCGFDLRYDSDQRFYSNAIIRSLVEKAEAIVCFVSLSAATTLRASRIDGMKHPSELTHAQCPNLREIWPQDPSSIGERGWIQPEVGDGIDTLRLHMFDSMRDDIRYQFMSELMGLVMSPAFANRMQRWEGLIASLPNCQTLILVREKESHIDMALYGEKMKKAMREADEAGHLDAVRDLLASWTSLKHIEIQTSRELTETKLKKKMVEESQLSGLFHARTSVTVKEWDPLTRVTMMDLYYN